MCIRDRYVRCRTCHFGSIETEFGEDQCPDCSSTMFVLVERCEHDNIDRHPTALILDGDGTEMMEWCDGAGIGDNDG